jgi:hypothetical protein
LFYFRRGTSYHGPLTRFNHARGPQNEIPPCCS